MGIISFIKGAWKLRKAISKYSEKDYRSSFYLHAEAVRHQIAFFEEINGHLNIENDDSLKALKTYNECVMKIVNDKFLEDACKMILKEKFDKQAFKKNRTKYVLEQPSETMMAIYDKEREMIELTIKIMTNILKDADKGLTSWYYVSSK